MKVRRGAVALVFGAALALAVPATPAAAHADRCAEGFELEGAPNAGAAAFDDNNNNYICAKKVDGNGNCAKAGFPGYNCKDDHIHSH